jgi:putative hydrolase of HD superfamily
MHQHDNGSLRRDTELLYELGTLRQVARAWVQFGNDQRLANVAEHSLRVIWLALTLAKHEAADAARVVQLALIHDLAETRTGDVNYVTRMYVDRDETQAMQDAVRGTSVERDVMDLWQEYQAQLTLESQIVKDADNLDCDFELMECASRGPNFKTTLHETRQRVRTQLRTETARRMFEQIYDTDPHDWHRGTKNRLTAGDWRDPALPTTG